MFLKKELFAVSECPLLWAQYTERWKRRVRAEVHQPVALLNLSWRFSGHFQKMWHIIMGMCGRAQSLKISDASLSVFTQSIPKLSFGQMAVEVLCLESVALVVCYVLPTGLIENEFNNAQHYLSSDWTQESQYTCIMICAQLSKTPGWSGMCFTCFYFAPFW